MSNLMVSCLCIGPRLGRPRSGRRKRIVQPNTGSRYRLETFFSEEENHTQAPLLDPCDPHFYPVRPSRFITLDHTVFIL